MTREEYGRLYHVVFGKAVSREACNQGWDRWQRIWKSGHTGVMLHLSGSPRPAPQEDDYHIVASMGELWFLARAASTFFTQVPAIWLAVPPDSVRRLGQNPRQRARAFVHYSLVNGYAMTPDKAPIMAGAIAWLLSTMNGMGDRLPNYHTIGYDITPIPGPPGQKTMFNFRAILSASKPGEALTAVRGLPLPEWRPPPH